MASKEDILEQLVEEYLLHRGYFVQHNVKFLPRKDHPQFISNQDSNHSDIDVLAINPKLRGPNRIWAVSCKSWQAGFKPEKRLRALDQKLKVGGREAWKSFRELCSPKWSEAFINAIEDATGSKQFTYVTAVTHINGDPKVWETHRPFIRALSGNPIKVVTLQEMLHEVSGVLSKTLAGTELGRTLQLFKAAGVVF
jgi:hypothetical protein